LEAKFSRGPGSSYGSAVNNAMNKKKEDNNPAIGMGLWKATPKEVLKIMKRW